MMIIIMTMQCELFLQEVRRYVGRLVLAKGVRIDPCDLKAVIALKSRRQWARCGHAGKSLRLGIPELQPPIHATH